jgi:hypothetical protein
LKYLHPQVLISSKIPKDGWSHKQELTDCVVVSRKTKNTDRKPKIVIVVKQPTFGDSVVYCAERYAKIKVEGEPDGFFDRKVDLPIIANAPTCFVNRIPVISVLAGIFYAKKTRGILGFKKK